MSSSLTITNCIFENNVARGEDPCGLPHGEGGALELEASNVEITGCKILGNFSWRWGGGIRNSYGNVTIIANCIIVGNSASQDGGGIKNSDGSSLTVTNCIIWQNTAPNGPQIYGSPSVTFGCIQDWTGGGIGNIDADPLFALGHWDPNDTPSDPNDDFWVYDDCHLKSEAGRWDPNTQAWVKDDVHSPCIDTGDPNYFTGELWPHGKRINMGAYGGTAEASMSLSDVGNIADLNEDDEVESQDLCLFGYDWLRDEVLLKSDLDRNGRIDLSDFSIMAFNWLWPEQ